MKTGDQKRTPGDHNFKLFLENKCRPLFHLSKSGKGKIVKNYHKPTSFCVNLHHTLQIHITYMPFSDKIGLLITFFELKFSYYSYLFSITTLFSTYALL